MPSFAYNTMQRAHACMCSINALWMFTHSYINEINGHMTSLCSGSFLSTVVSVHWNDPLLRGCPTLSQVAYARCQLLPNRRPRRSHDLDSVWQTWRWWQKQCLFSNRRDSYLLYYLLASYYLSCENIVVCMLEIATCVALSPMHFRHFWMFKALNFIIWC